MKMNNPVRIEITYKNVLAIILIPLLLYLAWYLRAMFFMLFFSFIFYSAFNPVVSYLEAKRVPRWLGITLMFLLVFVVITGFLVVGTNVVIEQVENFTTDFRSIVNSFIEVVEDLFPWLQGKVDSEKVTEDMFRNVDLKDTLTSSESINSAFGFLSSVASVALAIFTVVMLTIYMLAPRKKFYTGLVRYLSDSRQKRIFEMMDQIEKRLGAWFLGQLFLMFAIGFVTWVAVSLPGLFLESYTLDDYALPIALIAGFLEAIPNFGPTLTVAVAMVIAIGSGDMSTTEATVSTLVQSLYMLILGLVVQNLEAAVLVPTVTRKTVGIDPIITIAAIIGSISLFGFIGPIIVVPMIATAQIVFEEYTRKHS